MKQRQKDWGAVLAVTGIAALRRLAWQQRRYDDLRGEVALVTGGSRGLGFLIARELGRNGCRVAICARDAGEASTPSRATNGVAKQSQQCSKVNDCVTES